MSKNKSQIKEPFLRISKREGVSPVKAWGIRIIGLIAALLANAIFVYIFAGISPVEVYSKMFEGTFSNKIYRWDTFTYTAKLLLIAVALAPAFKMRFWNIGAEGQFLVGGLATSFVMINYGNSMPTPVLFIVMFVSAIFFGSLWGLIPAIFKANFGTNETLFTLMMNYVAIKLVDFFYDKWKGAASSLGKINKGTKAGYFPDIFGDARYINIIIVVSIAVLMFLYLKKTKHGYEISVVGESQNTAKYAGIDVKKVIIRTMVLSGAICGICGFMTVAGQEHTISSASGGGYGFTAIIVAWLSKMNTLYMAIVSLFIVFLEKGTRHIADQFTTFSDTASDVAIGIILFFVIGSEFFINYKLNFRTSHKGDK